MRVGRVLNSFDLTGKEYFLKNKVNENKKWVFSLCSRFNDPQKSSANIGLFVASSLCVSLHWMKT
jgi:hypothetical protein